MAGVKTGLFWQNRAYGHPGFGRVPKGDVFMQAHV